ncbi:hypothetical protein [Streptomyces sp. KR55]|uniref:hypothetical protein n=1 Tax=Streptomyces sp. KR55 TaxID=3457425 RepID=UPI003FD40B35
MPNLPPPVWAELFYSGAWNTITDDVRVTTSAIKIARGLTSESSSEAGPTSCECDLDSRDYKYAPRAPQSELFGKIGRNTGFRLGYTVGSPWAELSGNIATNDSIETPDNAALDVTGDFDLRLDVALDDWSHSQMLAVRYSTTGDNRCWALEILDGLLTFIWSPDGTLASRRDVAATEVLKAYNGQRLAVRVTLDVNNGAGGHEIRFYTGRTVNDEEWNLLGAPIVGTGTSGVFGGTAPLEIGAGTSFNSTPAGGVLDRMAGKAYALKLLNGITGTVAVAMAVSAATPGGTSFTDSTGLVWTKQGSAVFTNKHTRMAGEVPAWPPTRDLSGNDNYVSINPTGVTRRMDAGNKPQDSALLRYIKVNNPVECWPLTDGPTSTGARSLVGGSDMIQEILIGTDTAAEWSGGRLADWIEPTLSVKANTTGDLRGACRRTSGTDAFWSVDLFLSGGGTPSSGQVTIYDRGAGTDDDNRVSIQIIFTGSLDRLTVIRQSEGNDSSSSALLSNVDNVGIYNEDPHHIRLSIDPQASSTLWYLYVDGTLRANGTITSIVMKSVRTILLGWGFATIPNTTMTDRSFGFITYWDGNGPSAADIYDAYTGFRGEKAGTRIERLATESGYTASVAGETEYQRPMGIQGQKKLLELMNEASATNFGYLLDRRDATEVIHRGQSTLWNQPPALTLDFSAGLISPPFKPVDDDKLTENDVSVKREYGSVPARQVLEEGDLSVLDPEQGGVGRYDRAYTYSLETDAQADQVAHMRLHLGTYNGVRYTRITLNLANSRVFALIDDILRVDVGDKLRLTNVPEDHGPDDVDVLVAGYSEEAGPDAWLITFNCVPGEPWTAGVVGNDIYGHVDTDGSQLAAAVDATSTVLSVAVTDGPLWTADPTDVPWDIRVGGEVMTVQAVGQILNANSSFDTNVSGWSAFGGGTLAWAMSSIRQSGAAVLTTGAAAQPRFEATAVTGITSGAQYRATGWIFAGSALPAGVGINVNWYDSGGTYLSTSSNQRVPAVGVWDVWDAVFTAPASAARAGILLGCTGTPGAGIQVWGDDIKLIPLTSYSSSPQTLTVVRSVNGIVKAQPSGQDVRLANPVYVAM